MQSIRPLEMKIGEEYYIKSDTYQFARQIATCNAIHHIRDDMYVVDFSNIRDIKKQQHGVFQYGAGSRHCYWFNFYPTYKYKYFKKMVALYNQATTLYLQEIVGDSNFILCESFF